MTDNWFQQIMDDRDISIEDMAEVLDLSESTVGMYYNGYRKPTGKVLLNIIKILDLDVEDFYYA